MSFDPYEKGLWKEREELLSHDIDDEFIPATEAVQDPTEEILVHVDLC